VIIRRAKAFGGQATGVMRCEGVRQKERSEMGPVGVPEMAVIFVIALVLFGPKKLPELGRMLGTAISHFRRVRSEMKATFDRELQDLERQARSEKEIDGGYRHDDGNYDYSSSGAMIGGKLFASSSSVVAEKANSR
jgi:sec-independent protein translocase protein TatA